MPLNLLPTFMKPTEKMRKTQSSFLDQTIDYGRGTVTMKIYHLRNNLNDLYKSWGKFDCGAARRYSVTVYQPRQTETQVSLVQHIANMYICVKICLK